MPTPAGSLSAVVVTGGKQYRVTPGDRILVDRVAGEPGSELTLDRVLLIADGDDIKIGAPAVEDVTVAARVIGPARGPKIDVLRYKSKKRVRVHRGARADLTVLEIVSIGGRGRAEEPKAEAKAEPEKKPARSRTRAAAPASEAKAAPAPTRRRAPRASTTEEKTDGA